MGSGDVTPSLLVPRSTTQEGRKAKYTQQHAGGRQSKLSKEGGRERSISTTREGVVRHGPQLGGVLLTSNSKKCCKRLLENSARAGAVCHCMPPDTQTPCLCPRRREHKDCACQCIVSICKFRSKSLCIFASKPAFAHDEPLPSPHLLAFGESLRRRRRIPRAQFVRCSMLLGLQAVKAPRQQHLPLMCILTS